MANSNEYMREYMKARYYKRRAQAIVKLGGKCIDCGTTEYLEFDHVDASTKSFDLGKAFAGWSWERLDKELAKCVLRCNDCHTAKTKENDLHNKPVPHGGGKTGKRNCYCELCKPLKRKYVKEFRQASKALR